MSQCERLLYLNHGKFPGFLIKFHIFSNHSSAAQLNNDAAAERCSAHFSIRRNGIMLGGAELVLPPRYHILQGDFDNPFHEPFSDIPFNTHLQTLVALVEVEMSGWTCAGHSAKVVPPAPIRIGSRSVVMQWGRNFARRKHGLSSRTSRHLSQLGKLRVFAHSHCFDGVMDDVSQTAARALGMGPRLCRARWP